MAKTIQKADSIIDLLKSRFRELLDEISSEALTGHSIQPDRLESLRTLNQIIELRQNASVHRARRRWPLIGCSLLVSLIAAALIQRQATELDLQARVSGLSYTTEDGDAQYVLGRIQLREIHAQGLTTVHAPQLFRLAPPVPMQNVDFIDTSGKSGISLDLVLAPGGSTVSWAGDRVPGSYKLRIRGRAPLESGLLLNGALPRDVTGSLPSSASRRVNARPEIESPFSLRAAAEVTAQIITSPDTRFELPPLLRVRSVDLQIGETIFRPNNTPLEIRRPSILSGKIYLSEVKKEIPLRRYDPIQFEFIDGKIESLTAVPETADAGTPATLYTEPATAFLVHFHGSVRNLRRVSAPASSDTNPGLKVADVSLMPSWLEWVAAQPRLVLIWSGIVSALAAAGAALKLLELKK